MASEVKHVPKKKQKTKKIKQNQDDENKLTLEIVEKFGGGKKDIELLSGIEDDDEREVLDLQEDLEVDPVNREDLLNFIDSLQIRKHRPKFKNEEEEKKVVSVAEPKAKESKSPEVAKGKKKRNKYKLQHDEVSSTTQSADTNFDMSYIAAYQPRKYLLIKPGESWLASAPDVSTTTWDPAPENIIVKLEVHANKLLDDEVSLYRKQQNAQKSSDGKWLRTVLTSGTSTDKLAALTLVVQESPVHNLANLDTLIGMVTKKGHRMTLAALDRLKELFLTELLPETRKLKTFHQWPHMKLEEMCSGNKDTRDKILMLWCFEDQLKKCYANFVVSLQEAAKDNVVATKKKAVGAIFELLSSRPEQEKVLLSELVNKLGDPTYKVAAHCTHLLTKLVEKHSNMKQVVVQEVERLMYRPNIKPKAQYYAVCFLNQLILHNSDQKLALRLIAIYFSFFKVCVKQRDLESRMLSALLTGVNRAYPFAKMEKQKIEEQVQMMHKVLYSMTFNTSLQALMLLHHVSLDNDSMSDRFYMALYKKMTDPQLCNSSKQSLFLSLLFKSLKRDIHMQRVKAFVKRLLQVCCQHSPPFICGALLLLSELLKTQPGILKVETISDDSDDEEHFVDQPDDEEPVNPEKPVNTEKLDADTAKSTSSWLHKCNMPGKGGEHYDLQQRNPLYAHVQHEAVWELGRLTQHYHPTVSLYASNILKGEALSYSGNPLQDFTLIRFLDRFAFKNPKAKQSLPATESGKLFKSKQHKAVGVRAIPVNSEEYLTRGESSIPEDEKYLYRYMMQQAPKVKREEEEASDSEISDDDFDDYLDTYEKGLMAEAELDFAGDLGKLKMKGKKKKGKTDESDEESDEDVEESDEDVELSDEEVEFSEDEEMKGMIDDIMKDNDGDHDDEVPDEENISFSDDDFADIGEGQKKRKQRQQGFQSKKRKNDEEPMFAAAEEFSHLIEKNMGTGFDGIGSEAISNKDNASMKQLKWEQERARQLEGRDWKSIRAKKRTFKGKGHSKKNKPFKKRK